MRSHGPRFCKNACSRACPSGVPSLISESSIASLPATTGHEQRIHQLRCLDDLRQRGALVGGPASRGRGELDRNQLGVIFFSAASSGNGAALSDTAAKSGRSIAAAVYHAPMKLELVLLLSSRGKLIKAPAAA